MTKPLLLVLFLIISGCGVQVPVSPSSTFSLSPEEEKRLSESSDTDMNAAFKLYQFNSFVRQDVEQSTKYLRQAAKLGHGVSQFNLGSELMESTNESLRTEGRMCLQRAADTGDKKAIEVLKQFHTSPR